MKLRATLAIGALLLTSLVSVPASQAASCNQANQVRVTNGVKYVCKKVGSKLEWTKQRSAGVAAPVVTPKATPKPSVRPTPKPSPKPTIKAVEWSTCSKLAATSGTGPEGLICLLYEGQLTWISNAVLDEPYPFMPCRKAGATADWDGVLIRCVKEASGNIWNPEYEDPVEEPANTRTYTISGNYCHWNSVTPVIEKLEGGVWQSAGTVKFVPRAGGCGASQSALEASVRAPEGTEVRFRITTNRWTWYSTSLILGTATKPVLATSLPVVLTPLTSTVSVRNNYAGGYPSNFRLLSYTEFGDQSTFLFQVASTERGFNWNGPSAVYVGGVLVPFSNVTFSPAPGSFIAPNGTFSISLKRGSFQWDMTRLEFDQSASIASNFYTQRVTVNFTWR